MRDSRFFAQAELMLTVLPDVMAEPHFALKGGTAINLFVRDMPRLSVDIDLTYLPTQERAESLEGISNALERIAARINRHDASVVVHKTKAKDSRTIIKLVVDRGVQVKIEPNTVIRGTAFPCQDRKLCAAARDLFRLDVEARTLSLADLYGGKICAALDRQHPRDFFDIKVLLENEGLTDDVRRAFIVYLASHNRPMVELLDPRLVDFRTLFEDEFEGMTTQPVSYADLCHARDALVSKLLVALTEQERSFLLSIKDGAPKWDLIDDGAHISELPAIKWKVVNINKMTSKRRLEARNKLASLLGIR